MITQSFPVLLIAGLFGAIVGSFLNVVILRLPEKESLLFPASHCPHCNTPLHWYENIPVLSYLVLRGRCGHCRAGISWQYPVVELLTALLAVAIVFRFGLSFTAAGYFLFAAALVVVIFIDIHLQIIPDVISLPGILLGVFFALFSDALTWQSSLIGLFAGGGVLYAVAMGYLLWRKIDGMGGGDIKLLAMIGAWLGWQSLPFVILASSLGGALVGILAMARQGKGGQSRIPFGPFLSLAALLYLFFTEQIAYAYHLYLTGQWP
ncbi:MAG TPA: prepilin peptidase [Desulforhopalus sp.]|nr:prepilin peptidase [Desulforhopalus sp.]